MSDNASAVDGFVTPVDSAPAEIPPPQVLSIPVDGGACPAAFYRAEAANAPLVLHLHAGAFVSAPPDGISCVVRLLLGAGASVVSLDYPLAPAHPFPQAAETAHAALAYLHRKRRALSGPAAKLFVAGDEAGGNLAAAASLMARDRAAPALAGQILFSPMLDVCVGSASLRRAQAGPVGCRWADGWHDYLASANDALHPYATPGAAFRLVDLPATLLVTAADDAFHDETAAYARRLRGAGVPVDHLVLTPPTRFPAPYMEKPPRCDPAWAAIVRERLRRFLHPDHSSSQKPSRSTP